MFVSFNVAKSQTYELISRTENGDSGSWVIDPNTGNWLGHVVAGRPGTTVAYIVLARDIVKDITESLGIQKVRIACEAELEVTEVVSEIKRNISLDEPSTSHQGVSGGISSTPAGSIEISKDSSIEGTIGQDPPGKFLQIFSPKTTWSSLLPKENKQSLFHKYSSARNRIRGIPTPSVGTLTAHGNVSRESNEAPWTSTRDHLNTQRMVRDRGK